MTTPTPTPTGPSARSFLATTPVWRVGALASVVATIVTTLFALGAKAIDVPLEIGDERIPILGFAMLTLGWSAVGTVLAVVLARRAKRPARTWVVITVVLTVLSFASPISADADTATQVTLALSHVVAAAVVIPTLAVRLSHARPAGR